MKVYVAAAYEEKSEARKAAFALEESGHVVTSSWLHEKGTLPMAEDDVTADGIASTDLEDIEAADALIFLSTSTRGGSQVEFGYALALGKLMFCVCGGSQNIFHKMREIRHSESIFTVIDELSDLEWNTTNVSLDRTAALS